MRGACARSAVSDSRRRFFVLVALLMPGFVGMAVLAAWSMRRPSALTPTVHSWQPRMSIIQRNDSRGAASGLAHELYPYERGQDALVHQVRQQQRLASAAAKRLAAALVNLTAELDTLYTPPTGAPPRRASHAGIVAAGAGAVRAIGPGAVGLFGKGGGEPVRIEDLCRRRDCAKRTQCRYAELERDWRRSQPGTQRYDPALQRFVAVPFELDPAKIWYLFPEVYACPSMQRVGPLYDGGKWTCVAHLLSPPCVVYSMGTWDDVSFELALEGRGCHVHAFELDPAPVARIQHIFDARKSWQLHNVGVGGRDDPANNVRDIRGLIRELGHARVDLIKMDIEGSEFEVVAALRDAGVEVDEMIIEVHNPTLARMKKMVHDLDSLGLQAFARESNTLASQVEDATKGHACCAEYSFTRIPQTAQCAKVLHDLEQARGGDGGDGGEVTQMPCVDSSGALIQTAPDCE